MHRPKSLKATKHTIKIRKVRTITGVETKTHLKHQKRGPYFFHENPYLPCNFSLEYGKPDVMLGRNGPWVIGMSVTHLV